MRNFIIIMVTAIFSVLPSSSQNVCDKIRLSSGKVVDFNYALTQNDTAYICLDQPEANADWRIETYIDGKIHNAEPDIHVIKDANGITLNARQIDWFCAKKFEDNGFRYYKCKVTVFKNNRTIFSKDIKFDLLPSKPRIHDVRYDYIYNVYYVPEWDKELLSTEGNFSATIESRNSTYLFLALSDCWIFNKKVLYQTQYVVDKINETEGVFNGEKIEWGNYMYAIAGNEYGSVNGDTICTNDYITDPVILAKIEELRSKWGGVDDVMPNDTENRFKINGGFITVEDIEAPYSITVYDIAGTVVKEEINNPEICIKDLNPGCYIVALQTKGRKYTKKFIKS